MLLNAIIPTPLLRLSLVAALAVISVACFSERKADDKTTPVLSAPPSATFPVPPANAPADVGWLLTDGKRARVSDFSGKVLALDFYATWCQPCRLSIPRLIALQQSYGAQGLQVVGLNVGGPDDRIKVNDFARDLGIQYPLGFPDKAMSDLFLSDNQTIPQTFIFGRDGKLRRRFIGYDQATENELERVIRDALND
ncbi:MAG TPA: TlpA disulfide reductase family protein [Pyrinomonadaceae bacterium]|nr:TlpA disulfide reductase family protein [Pyrinomonadaceae bacterium]